jgi:1-deoxy-D-xylulose-5-phosphate reductoisomerase
MPVPAVIPVADKLKLTFEQPDIARFPALRLARAAISEGGAQPAILNAANEVAVAAFLNGQIGFLDIANVVSSTLDGYSPNAPHSLEHLFSIDAAARSYAKSLMEKLPHAA